MSFGIDFFDAAGDLRWGATQYSMPCIDIWAYQFAGSTTRDYPELEGATIRCETSPTSIIATVTYPGGIPTISISNVGMLVYTAAITVFLETLPSSLETQFSWQILNDDGTHAVSPLNTILELVESISTTATGALSDSCGSYSQIYGATSSYYASVAKADYPNPPFVMIDLPNHPYFGGQLDIQDNLGTSSDWLLRISGTFVSAPTLYLFRNRGITSPPSTGVGIALMNPDGDCIFASSDNLLGFTGPPEVPEILEFDVPAALSGSVTIGNLDQIWTPAVALPTNALVWMQAKQIVAVEQCYSPGKGIPMDRVIREWTSGVCRYDTTDLMLRLKTVTSFTRAPEAVNTEWFYGDINGGDYVGSCLIADKDRVI
jgi:hypothetical protein